MFAGIDEFLRQKDRFWTELWKNHFLMIHRKQTDREAMAEHLCYCYFFNKLL